MYAEAEMLVILKKSWCTDTEKEPGQRESQCGQFPTSVFLLQTAISFLPI